MLTALSRTLFWIAAIAAGLALLGPDRLATWLTATAGIGLLLAYGAWRLALAQDRRQGHDDEVATAPGQLDELALLDIATRLAQAIAASPGFEPALHAAAATLRAELGAREITVHRVLAIEAPIAELATLVDTDPGGIGVQHRVRLERSPLGQALRERRVAGDGFGPFALPVLRGEAVAAVIEIGPVALQAAPGALSSLFELARSQLALFARVDGAPDDTKAEEGARVPERLDAQDGAAPFDLARVDRPGLDGSSLAGASTAPARATTAKPVHDAELLQTLMGVTSARQLAPAAAPHLGRTVLVVEDNTGNREVIVQMLRQSGCLATVASGAMEGLRELCEQAFDLVLIDSRMAGMHGVEVLRTIRCGTDARRALRTLPDVPVVAVTADAAAGDEQRYLALGFDGYLSKPLRQGSLIAMLNRYLSPSEPLPKQDAPDAGAGDAGGRPQPQGTVLDPQALGRLRELDPRGENRLLERVLKAFETSVARLAPQLEESRRSGDRAGIRHVAHTLKSSSASIGAMALSQRCAEVEAMIRLESTEIADLPLDALRAELELVLKAIASVLDHPA
jgi:CheY-like chemotaxis protein/HPt (histidine-containing phosphotransfer) domain-containing protein